MKRLILLVFVLFVVASPAHGFGRRSAATSSSSYYYAAPSYVVPYYYQYIPPTQPWYVMPAPPPYTAPPVMPMQPATSLPNTPPIVIPGFAAPAPAPPSLTPEPTESSTSMRVNTKYYDLFPTANGKAQGDRCSVAFWNLTGRTVTVNVNGENRTLTNGQSLTVDVARSFRWQVDGRGAETVKLAASDKGAEILIRK